MKFIISESQYKKYFKSSKSIQGAVNEYLNSYISKGDRKVGKKSRNYGNLREDWCVNGLNTITSVYYFDNEGHNDGEGSLLVSEDLVNDISSFFSIRTSYTLHLIEEWYDDTMVPKFESIVGETGLFIANVDTLSKAYKCIPEPVKPEGITDDEMIDYIVKNTLYKRNEVIDKINSGERDIEDFYLDVVDTVARKNELL